MFWKPQLSAQSSVFRKERFRDWTGRMTLPGATLRITSFAASTLSIRRSAETAS